MGEAKRRGTREQRIAQALERRQHEEAKLRERIRQEDEAQQERIAALPPEARKEALMRRSSPKHRNLMLAAALALSMSPISTTAKK